MKRNLTFVLHAIGGIALLAAAVGAAMWLWNTLIPDIFGWKPVGYWQMLGLLALAHLFFGHLGHSGWHEHRHIHRAMHGMSHEERREFIRQRIRSYREENPTDECPENNPAEVFGKYRRQLGAFIARRIPSREEAEDILQDVFMRFVQTDALNPVTQVAAWLFRAARNRIIDHSRKRREERMPQMRGQDDESGFVSEITALLTDEESSPEMEYLRTLVWEEVEKALGELPAAQRDVFELTEMEGFTFRELAEDTGIPVATLLSRKHYAVKHLRNRLAEVYEALLTE